GLPMHSDIQMGACYIYANKLGSLLDLHRTKYECRGGPCCRRELARIGDRDCIMQVTSPGSLSSLGAGMGC
ncbi:hypothetical protein, partial [Ottowia thiooxydans]|uniref:hypothetical protein n=1 Tax=Ottowia thiooxydans TaxID=219182 RepID=UPI001B7FD804